MNECKDRTCFWIILIVAVLAGVMFHVGQWWNNHKWEEEVVGRGFAHHEGKKLIWDK